MDINRTYRNDGSLSAYPFLQQPSMVPFPLGCVRAIGVCVAFPVSAVSAVGVSLSAGSVSVALSATPSDGGAETPLCTLSAAPGKYASASERGRFCAWLMAGHVPAAAYGSYSGEWRLDPACVSVRVPEEGSMKSLYVNGVEHALGDVLSISASGLLALSEASDRLGKPVAALSADIPDTTGALYAASVASDYAKVDGILSSGTASELKISIEDAGGHETAATADYVTLDIDFMDRNGNPVTALDPTGEGSVNEELRTRLDTHGEAVIVTINGHKGLPNCYASSSDEALD